MVRYYTSVIFSVITADHYRCAHPGVVNAAGDSLRSLAESHGLSKVIKYLDDYSADSAGEGVVWL